jgi:hypothetical protein
LIEGGFGLTLIEDGFGSIWAEDGFDMLQSGDNREMTTKTSRIILVLRVNLNPHEIAKGSRKW